jgi:2',3'-cyclic-nucleotide 2'-phosphodiesterase (5'-nucleotidase family)
MARSGSLRHRASVGVVAVCVTALALVTATAPSSAAKAKPKPHKPRLAQIQLLTFNDFHGNLETGGTIPTRYRLNADGSPVLDSNGHPLANFAEAGGVAYLGANLARARAKQKYTITAAAGDLIGASPLLSAAFHDEPSIEALGGLGLEVSSVGNHEFDEGADELVRMQNGGCLPDGEGVANQNSCPGGRSFAGARFRYLAANVVVRSTGRPMFPSYWIKNFGDGIKIAFIGMTLKGTSKITPKAGVAPLAFLDEVATANALVPRLKKLGVQSIVVLLHQGGDPNYRAGTKNPVHAGTPANFRCGGSQRLTKDSPIIPIAQKLNPAIDLIVSGHTHQPYVCSIADPLGHPRLVTSASSYGRLFTDIRLTYDRRTHNIVRTGVRATNKIVAHNVTPQADLASLVSDYKAQVAPLANRVIGKAAVSLPNASSPSGEKPLGDLIADAFAAEPGVAAQGEPDVAFTTPRGVHGSGWAAGDVTFGDVFRAQPGNHLLVSMTLTGQQIIDLLNQQWNGPNYRGRREILQASEGFSYRWTANTIRPVLDASSVQIGGAPLVRTQTYRVVTIDYLSEGSSGFTVFAKGTNRLVGGLDIDALSEYISAYTADHGAWAPPSTQRITRY